MSEFFILMYRDEKFIPPQGGKSQRDHSFKALQTLFAGLFCFWAAVTLSLVYPEFVEGSKGCSAGN
jgi:hypothetical protein